jgi:hypothetical protein
MVELERARVFSSLGELFLEMSLLRVLYECTHSHRFLAVREHYIFYSDRLSDVVD